MVTGYIVHHCLQTLEQDTFFLIRKGLIPFEKQTLKQNYPSFSI